MNLLIRCFVKNSEDVENPQVRSAYGILMSIVGIVSNLLLFLMKLLIGLAVGSISVMADAFNNLSDAASSVISLIGIWLAKRPADKEHPFGHGRYEYISAFIIAFLVLEVAFSCFKSSIQKILNPQDVDVQPVILVILSLSIGVKLWLSYVNKRTGNRIHSTVMKATAADAFGDVLITSATVLALLVEKLFRIHVDGYMGLAVSLFVFWTGFRIARDTLRPLLGEAVDQELYHKITKKVESYAMIIGSHDLVVHNYGPTHTMATIHCEVPNNVNMEDAHEVIDQIERDVLREDNIFLVVHMDPVEINDVRVAELKEKVALLVASIDKRVTIHDFRMVSGEHHVNLIFDLVVPYRYHKKDEEELLERVQREIKQLDERYACVISLENSYISEQ